MTPVFKGDEPLPYPRLKHRTRWPGTPLSEEYLIPPEDKQQILELLYPYMDVPGLDDTLMDIHEEREFAVREFKVVREGGMNMLVSPYYYRSGGSVIDWVPVGDLSHCDESESEQGSGFFGVSMSAHPIKSGAEARLMGLIVRQH